MVIKLIRRFLSLMRTQLKIKIHITKLKVMKDQRQNIQMKMNQMTQKQTKLLQFLTLFHNYYQMINLQKA